MLNNKMNYPIIYIFHKLIINYVINIPNDDEFKAYEEKSENNYKLFYEILKHLNLKVDSVKEINIQKDGNCFYNNLSFFYTNTQEYNLLFRFILFQYCSDYIEEIRKKHPLIYYYGKNYKTKDYIKRIKNNSFFAGDFELSQAVYVFKLNIAIYEKIIDDKDNILGYKYIKFYENETLNDKKIPLMILSYNDKEEHYQQLIFNEYNIDNNMKSKVESNKNS